MRDTERVKVNGETAGARQVCIMDSEQNASRIAPFLAETGYRVVRCTSCGARCDAEKTHPDVILLNASGGEAAFERIRSIRERPGLRQVPLVAYDSVTDPDRKAGLMHHGASDYLRVPFGKTQLLEKIGLHAYYQSQLRSFSRFVPEAYLHLMEKRDLVSLDLGDFKVLPMSVLFTDIRSFTEISENLPPQDIFKFLNSLFSRMEPVIKNNHGFIDKYIGDAVLALFPGTADDCLKAGLDLLGAVRLYNSHRAGSGYAPVHMGLGVHVGDVALGIVGARDRLNATVIGDSVNLASRVETLTKVFGVDIILTDAIYHGLSDPRRYNLREIDTVRVKGKQTPIILYEAFDADPADLVSKKTMMMGDYERGLALYKKGDFQGAMDQFTTCKDFCPEDKIPDIYIRRCNSLIRIPPGKDWAGITTL